MTKKHPTMSDFGLLSFVGNAPEWTEQGKKQAAFCQALEDWEKESKSDKHKQENGRDDSPAGSAAG